MDIGYEVNNATILLEEIFPTEIEYLEYLDFDLATSSVNIKELNNFGSTQDLFK